MSGRTTRVTVYVTEDRKTELEERADAADDSVSGIVNDIIDDRLQADAQEEVASATRAEERIQELISLGVEELTEVAEDLRERQTRAGAHAIATFELQKRGVAEPVRREALATGARRIRGDSEDVEAGIQSVAAAEGGADTEGTPAGETDPPSLATDGSPPGDQTPTDQPDDPEQPNQAADLFDRLRSDRR